MRSVYARSKPKSSTGAASASRSGARSASRRAIEFDYPSAALSFRIGLAMALDLQAAADEYLGWLQLEANRSPNTVRAYAGEIRRLAAFLSERNHSLDLTELRHEDLRAFQRHLALKLKSPASRARALVAIRSWLRWLAREE